ncbi:MAG: PorP/SprF family type IX secretion system membrane protein [Candidatus Cyclobacteriaceae bacterium M3_2C_046]
MENKLNKLVTLLYSNKITGYKYLFVIIVCLLSVVEGFSQDTQFSQYFKAPLILNPAFAGATKHQRLNVNYRNQWPELPKAFASYAFSYDLNVDKYNSGFGLLVTTNRAGSAGFRSSSVGYAYSYKIRMGNWVASPGLSFTYGYRDIDFQRLVFGDQLEFNGPTVDDAAQKFESISYFDFSSGFILYNKSFWIGYAMHHMNEPNFSFLDGQSLLPRKHSIHSGITIPLYNGPFNRARISYLAPSVIFKKQGEFTQLDFGSTLVYDPVSFGLWYRGIPFKKNPSGRPDHDALVGVVTMKVKDLEFGYSYDITLSGLGTATGGAHEISLSYLLNTRQIRNNHKPQKRIPCPVFYDEGLF